MILAATQSDMGFGVMLMAIVFSAGITENISPRAAEDASLPIQQTKFYIVGQPGLRHILKSISSGSDANHDRDRSENSEELTNSFQPLYSQNEEG